MFTLMNTANYKPLYAKLDIIESGKKMLCAVMFGAMSVIPAQASDFIFRSQYLDYELPKSVSEVCQGREDYHCPEIEIQYANSSQSWINNLINARINELLPDSESINGTAIPGDDSVRNRLDRFAHSQLNDIPAGSSLNYSFQIEPTYWGHVGNVELFEVDSYLYLAGAHGMPYSEYIMLDSQTKQQIKLDDILVSGKKKQLQAKVYQAYKTWVKQNSDEAESYEKMWPFELTDNVLLTDEGVSFKYQAYQISPFAYGLPELTIPYSELKGIIAAKYIPR